MLSTTNTRTSRESGHDQRKRQRGWPLLVIVPWALILLAWAILPALSTTENATVYLGDCVDPECALKGDLSVNLFTRDYELTQPDSSVVIFDREAVKMMSWPVPEN